MALIQCQKCKAEISEMTSVCPVCGMALSINEGIQNPPSDPVQISNSKSAGALFFMAWIHPRKVMQDKSASYFVGPLIIAYVLFQALSLHSYIRLLKHLPLPGALLVGAPVGIILGYVSIVIVSWALQKTGNLLGGMASYEDLKAAFAWALPPLLFGDIFLLIARFPIWSRIFNGMTDQAELLAQVPMWAGILGIVYYLFLIWFFILYLINISEANEFSVGKSILSVVLSFLAMVTIGIGLKIVGELL